MDKDQENPCLPGPVIGSCYLQFVNQIFSKSFHLLLVLNCGAIIGGVFLRPYVSTKIFVLMYLLLLTSVLVRNKGARWSNLFLPRTTDSKIFITGNENVATDVQVVHAKVLTHLQSILENRDLCQTLGGLTSAYVIAKIIKIIDLVISSGSLANDVTVAICLSSLFPLVAAAVLKLQNHIAQPNYGASQSAAKTKPLLKQIIKSVYLPNFSYSCCFAGFTYLFFLLSYLPHGIGTDFCNWLYASMLDASIPGPDNPPLTMQIAVSTILFIALMTTFINAIMRFSAGYQLFLKRAIVFKDSMLDALRATVKINPIKVEIPERHPHLHDAFSTAIWITSVYGIIFAGVAFCPGPLGETVHDYLQDCLRTANLAIDLRSNFGLLVFLASVIAAYATIPVAVMSCSFLSTKKVKYVLASPEGILMPCDGKTLIGYSPIMQWERLNRISLEKADNPRKQYLKFSFDQAFPLKLKVSETNKESLFQLLNAADEYSKKCLIEKPVLDLRKQLSDETKSHTMANTKQFSSTVFSLLKTGDELKGRYRIVRKLAGKSLSAVYLARNASNELVVVKEFLLPENLEACTRLDATFVRECNLVKKLEHPGIAKVIEFFEERTAKYLVIEHIAGTDLRELVNKSGSRKETSVREWALSIASTMSYLHAHEPAILHRDLTPDNLMIDNDGALKLIDFGASHQFIEGVTGTLIGKQCYIAPEQLRGKPCIESDIYSFGCTLYFLLTGQDPKALQQSDTQLSDVSVSQSMRQIIIKCTEFEPDNRLHSFADVISVLSAPTLSYLETNQSKGKNIAVAEHSYGH